MKDCLTFDMKLIKGKINKNEDLRLNFFLLYRCVEKISGRIEVDVPGTYCDPADIPAEEEDCRLFCPEECVVSEWTEWSSCLSVRCFHNFC